MRNNNNQRRHRGLSLMETLISVSLAAALMVSVATAFTGSSQVIHETEQFNQAVQAARVSLNRILTELRTAQSAVVDNHAIEIITLSGQKHLYSLNSSDNSLQLTLPDNIPVEVTYTMAHHISGIDFDTDTKTITVLITASVGKNSIVLSGSSTPRRNVEYK